MVNYSADVGRHAIKTAIAHKRFGCEKSNATVLAEEKMDRKGSLLGSLKRSKRKQARWLPKGEGKSQCCIVIRPA